MPRAGKYCPRCQTMTFVDREICENCGHHFRTGISEPNLDAKLDEDAKHRTMQFTLPPMPTRLPPKTEDAGNDEAPLPERDEAPLPERDEAPVFRPLRRRLGPALALAALIVAALLVAAALALGWHRRAPEVSASARSPVGVWESVLTSRSSANTRLTFALAGDGSGTFSWQEGGAGGASAASGRSPLRWREDANGLLALTIAPAPAGDAVSGTMIAIFNSHAWLWRVDRPHKRLMLGSLAFTEK